MAKRKRKKKEAAYMDGRCRAYRKAEEINDERVMRMKKKRNVIRRDAKIKPSILAVISETGEMSQKAVRILRGCPSKKSKNIKDMLERGWLKKDRVTVVTYYKSGKVKAKKTRYILNDIESHYDEWSGYTPYSVKNDIKENVIRLHTGNASTHERALQQSEVMALMYECDVSINDIPHPLEQKKAEGYRAYRYYSSREIKKAYDHSNMKDQEAGDEKNTIKRSRSFGVVYTDTDIYTVFNLGTKSSIRLDDFAEQKFFRFCAAIAGKEEKDRKRIFVCDNYHKLYDIMYHAWMVNAEAKYKKPSAKTMLDSPFAHTLLIPCTNEGKLILEIMLHEGKAFFDEEVGTTEYNNYAKVDCDRLTKDGETFVFELNFLFPDLERLKRFLTAGENDPDCVYIVHAYKEAAEELEKITEHVQIQPHDINISYQRYLVG